MKRTPMKKQSSSISSGSLPSRQSSATSGTNEQSKLDMASSQSSPGDGSQSVDKVDSAEDNYFAAMMGTHDAVKSIEGVGFVALAPLEPQPNLVMTDLQSTFATHSVLEKEQRSQFYANKSQVAIESDIVSKTRENKEAIIPTAKARNTAPKLSGKTNSQMNAKVKVKKQRRNRPRKATVEQTDKESKRSNSPRRNINSASSTSSKIRASSPSIVVQSTSVSVTKSPSTKSMGSGRSTSTSSISPAAGTASATQFTGNKQTLSTSKVVLRTVEKKSTQKGEQRTKSPQGTFKKFALGKSGKQGKK